MWITSINYLLQSLSVFSFVFMVLHANPYIYLSNIWVWLIVISIRIWWNTIFFLHCETSSNVFIICHYQCKILILTQKYKPSTKILIHEVKMIISMPLPFRVKNFFVYLVIFFKMYFENIVTIDKFWLFLGTKFCLVTQILKNKNKKFSQTILWESKVCLYKSKVLSTYLHKGEVCSRIMQKFSSYFSCF